MDKDSYLHAVGDRIEPQLTDVSLCLLQSFLANVSDWATTASSQIFH